MHLIVAMAGAGSRTRSLFPGPKPFLPISSDSTLLELSLSGLPWNVITEVTFAVNDEVAVWIEENAIELAKFLPEGVAGTMLNVGGKTDGQASTARLALQDRDGESPLLISNCDTYFTTNFPKDYLDFDGLLGVFESSSPLYSYAKVSNGLVTETAEKRVISTHASSGLYFFRTEKLYLECLAQTDLEGEKYIAPIYNQMIQHKAKVGVFEHDFVVPLGTAEEIRAYIDQTG